MSKTVGDYLRQYLTNRRRAYSRTFTGRDADVVLADLAKFCRATETCVTPDDRATAVLEGRREVWLRIQRHLNLSDPELWRLHEVDRQEKTPGAV